MPEAAAVTVATAASPFVTVAVCAATKPALRERNARTEGNSIAEGIERRWERECGSER